MTVCPGFGTIVILWSKMRQQNEQIWWTFFRKTTYWQYSIHELHILFQKKNSPSGLCFSFSQENCLCFLSVRKNLAELFKWTSPKPQQHPNVASKLFAWRQTLSQSKMIEFLDVMSRQSKNPKVSMKAVFRITSFFGVWKRRIVVGSFRGSGRIFGTSDSKRVYFAKLARCGG